MYSKGSRMNPFSPVNLPDGNRDDSWIFPAFIAFVIFISIWWAG